MQEIFSYLSTGQTRSIPNVFLLYPYRFLSSYLESAAIYNTNGKENTEVEEALKEHTSDYPVH